MVVHKVKETPVDAVDAFSSPAPPWRFIAALVVSILLHALLFMTSKQGHGGYGHTPLALSVQLQPMSSDPRAGRLERAIAIPRGESPLAVPATASSAHPEAKATPVDRPPVLESSEPGWIANLGLPFDAQFYKASELEQLAFPMHELYFDVPQNVPDSVKAGHVTLRVKIDEFGVVVGVEVEAADPPGVFDQAAVTAFERARFLPATRGGQFVRSVKEVDVCFGDCMSAVPEGVDPALMPAATVEAPAATASAQPAAANKPAGTSLPATAPFSADKH